MRTIDGDVRKIKPRRGRQIPDVTNGLRCAVKSCLMCRARDNIRALRRVGCDSMQTNGNYKKSRGGSYQEFVKDDGSKARRIKTRGGYTIEINPVRDKTGQHKEYSVICNSKDVVRFIARIKRNENVTLYSANGCALIHHIKDGLFKLAIDSNRQPVPLPPTREIKINLNWISNDSDYFYFYRNGSTKTPAIKVFYIKNN